MSFCLPKVSIPNIEIEYDDELLTNIQVYKVNFSFNLYLSYH